VVDVDRPDRNAETVTEPQEARRVGPTGEGDHEWTIGEIGHPFDPSG